MAGVTLQPIHRITQTTQTIGNERDFTRRVDCTVGKGSLLTVSLPAR